MVVIYSILIWGNELLLFLELVNRRSVLLDDNLQKFIYIEIKEKLSELLIMIYKGKSEW